jgi:hypothetical protein
VKLYTLGWYWRKCRTAKLLFGVRIPGRVAIFMNSKRLSRFHPASVRATHRMSLASIRTSPKFRRRSYALYIRFQNPRGKNSQKSLHAEIWLIATFMHFSTGEMYFTCQTTTVNPFWLTIAWCISHYIHISLTKFLWTVLQMSKFADWVTLSFPHSDWFPTMRLISDAPFPSDQQLTAGQYEYLNSTVRTMESTSFFVWLRGN